jgi:hypothetical protein
VTAAASHALLAEVTDASVCLVDRGGIGWSDPAPWPRTPSTMADEVDAMTPR